MYELQRKKRNSEKNLLCFSSLSFRRLSVETAAFRIYRRRVLSLFLHFDLQCSRHLLTQVIAKHRKRKSHFVVSMFSSIQNEMKETDGELGEKTNKIFLLKNLREIEQLVDLGLLLRGMVKYVA